jgi:long-chain acyl-CoA synthetase
VSKVSHEKPWLAFYQEGVSHRLEFPEQALNDLFSETASANPSGVAVSYFGKKLTYRELQRDVNQLATALTRLGVKKGDRVAIILPNVPQYPIAHFAILKLGAIIVPTNPLYVERELKYQMNDSGAETAIIVDFLYPRLANVKAETGVKNIIVTGVQEYLPTLLGLLYPIKAKKEGNWHKVSRGPGVHFYKELMTEDFTMAAPEVEVSPDDTAMFLYTGGTTGRSKGATLTHRNLVSNVRQIREWFVGCELDKEILLCALPFFHSYGLTTGLHLAVLLRSTMVLIPNPRDIKMIMSTVQKTKATMFSGVPTLYVAVNNFKDLAKYDISSIKTCVSGGAPLPVSVSKEFESNTGGKLVEGYGLSETSPVTHVNPLSGLRKEGAMGIPIPNTDAKIVDPETKQDLDVGEVGELAVKGPQVMKGYWNLEKETTAVLADGWLFTGDMAKRDEDGYFYIVDRKKDMIIAGGFNIYPREVEEVLYEHDMIEEAAVVGVQDEYRGETVKAYVVLKKEASLDEKAVIAYCREKLAVYKAPKLVEFRESLPKSNIGKVLKRVLLDEETQKADHPA